MKIVHWPWFKSFRLPLCAKYNWPVKAFKWCDVQCVTLQHHVAMRYAKGVRVSGLGNTASTSQYFTILFSVNLSFWWNVPKKKKHPKIFGARLWHFSCWDVNCFSWQKTGSEYQRQLTVSLSLCIDLSHRSGIASPRQTTFLASFWSWESETSLRSRSCRNLGGVSFQRHVWFFPTLWNEESSSELIPLWTRNPLA